MYIYMLRYSHFEVDRLSKFQSDSHVRDEVLKFPYSIYSRMTYYNILTMINGDIMIPSLCI